MTTYLSGAARDQLRAAQSQLDRHTPSSADGRCPACRVDEPCSQRRAALRVFGRYGCLPRRWPGASRPERVQASSWSGWLTAAVEGVTAERLS
ncbi:hypothetical protein GCM10011608_08990 [Micromonospora sonchi]|uniref:Uncharacterized protein n=1 Tax=Micromonospora sonchi TaxID=1763543 RepID=A0A917WTD6_9ACTN|nr:hypothetical protein [Micromonospora sonchi]GGM26461.1 hypothetical protein GCM10011608_08990 [Micromonospora sonchi]